MSSIFDLTGKTAVVTGAAGGLGSAAAACYAANGADVAMLDLDRDALVPFRDKIADKYGKQVLTYECDISDEKQVQQTVQQIQEKFGKIDILLNNAGIAVEGGVDTLSLEDWNKGLSVNLTGMFLVSKYIVPGMIEREYGKIVNTASINAELADKQEGMYRHVYNASKAGVVGLTKAMAASYAKHNITVNAVGPGLFETNMTSGTLFEGGFDEMYNKLAPAGRPGRDGELSGTLVYLSSDASSYVQGQLIFVDGGFSLV